MPLTGGQTPTVVAVAGRPIPPLSERATATRHLVSPRYFSTLGIPLRAGRDFDERDNTRVPHVVIINETFARRHFPGEDPIGRTLVTGMAQRPAQVVGVVADIRGENLNTAPEPEYFLPVLQRPEALTNVLVRSHLPPAAVAPLVREALRTIDPDLPLLQPDALTTRIAQTVANRKLALMLLVGVRGARARAREPRRLQRDGAPGGIPHERDRPAHGAGRVTGRGDAHGARSWPRVSRWSASRSASPVRWLSRG